MTVVMTPATMPALKCCLKTECWEGKKGRREGGREGGREREGEGERREGGRV